MILRAPVQISIQRPGAALLVDRDRDTREMYAEYLRRFGWEIDEATDGREALAKTISKRPDVVVTAIRLPGMSGLDLCRVLRRDPVTSTIPVVFVTGDASESDAQRALSAGAARVIAKPCLPDTLLLEIKQVLGTPEAQHAESKSVPGPTPPRPESAEPLTSSHRRVMLNHVHSRHVTTEPSIAPPALVCPSCYQPLEYSKSYIGGVSVRHPEQWDYFECRNGCGTFQYRHRTRKLKQIR